MKIWFYFLILVMFAGMMTTPALAQSQQQVNKMIIVSYLCQSQNQATLRIRAGIQLPWNDYYAPVNYNIYEVEGLKVFDQAKLIYLQRTDFVSRQGMVFHSYDVYAGEDFPTFLSWDMLEGRPGTMILYYGRKREPLPQLFQCQVTSRQQRS